MLLKLQKFDAEKKVDELIEVSQVKVDLKKINSLHEAEVYEESIGREVSKFFLKEQVRTWPSDAYLIVYKTKDIPSQQQSVLTYDTGIFLCNEMSGKTVDILSRRK